MANPENLRRGMDRAGFGRDGKRRDAHHRLQGFERKLQGSVGRFSSSMDLLIAGANSSLLVYVAAG